jgi:hypothetical protein
MNWLEHDRLMQADGWQLQITRVGNEWRVFYSHVAHLPVTAKGKSLEEVFNKIKESL